MTNRPILLAPTAVLSLFCLHVWSQPKKDNPQWTTLRFFVVDTFGNPVPNFRYIMEDSANQFDFRGTTTNAEPLKIPFGYYRVQVSALGFEPYITNVTVRDRETWVPVGLLIGSIIDTKPRSSLTVSVSVSAHRKWPTWVKLIELYSDHTMDAQCDGSGVARFTNLRPGKNILLLFDSFELRSKREIELHDGENTVRFD